jgi:valyl-tRNA synthetase
MKKIHMLNEKYNPKDFEDKIYDKWEKNGYFRPNGDKSKKSFSIVMPPPNVTGKLHMGHALDGTIQDLLIRFKRMQGYNTLWIPGTDHSALPTEAKIVEEMKKEGLKKSDIGREKFLERAWDWTRLYGGTIVSQQRKLGCSCDWSRARFTMDEGLSKAVYEAFSKLYNRGLIYKGKRMINYCPGCHTSISDAEVEYKEETSHLWYIKYPIVGEEKYVTVATTRPETMLGDTAVTVNPKDERYKDIIGKKVKLPIVGREIPIIEDRFVEMEFGTGCVKVTPAHDVNDYQSGIEHNLEIIEVFDENLKMNDIVPEYKGKDIYEARKLIVERLEKEGYLLKTEDYTHNVAKCDRCKTTIEPRISDQWFVKMEELAKPAIKAVEEGKVKFIPKKYDATYFNWMKNIKDWCISRQIWWGHQIPAYYCDECGEITVSSTTPEKCCKCGCKKLTQDPDTLDTWFSSALWPFSTMGWPNTETEDYKTFYPTNTLVTGYDIIQAWVSRMIYSALAYTEEVPFNDVLIHGIVRDSQGRKMSKSLGNGIDPLEIVENYSADALRFSLIMGITAGNDIRYMPEKLDSAKNFANKLWNASKFVLMNLEDYKEEKIDLTELAIEDKWIISKLNTLVKEATVNLEKYDLGVATTKIYDFIWNEFCDWYIEIVKTRLYNKEDKTRKMAQYTLNKVLCDVLKILHPIMPFITEEIYTKLYNEDESIMISNWPEYDEKLSFNEDEKILEKLQEIIVNIRNLRANMNVPNSKKTKLIFVTNKYKIAIEKSTDFLKKMGYAEEIIIQENRTGISEKSMSIVIDGIEVYLPIEELVNIEEEKKRLETEKKKIQSEIERASKMLSNQGFINKAPETKINEEKTKLEKYKEMLINIEERLKNMK